MILTPSPPQATPDSQSGEAPRVDACFDALALAAIPQRQGDLRPEPIQRLWRQHLSGRFDHTTRLWTVLMWQAWLAEWG